MDSDVMLSTFRAGMTFLRLSRGVSQEKLARGIGLTPAAVTMWESGLRDPRLTSAMDAAAFLGGHIGIFDRAAVLTSFGYRFLRRGEWSPVFPAESEAMARGLAADRDLGNGVTDRRMMVRELYPGPWRVHRDG